jgi:hypothetical protein
MTSAGQATIYDRACSEYAASRTRFGTAVHEELGRLQRLVAGLSQAVEHAGALAGDEACGISTELGESVSRIVEQLHALERQLASAMARCERLQAEDGPLSSEQPSRRRVRDKPHAGQTGKRSDSEPCDVSADAPSEDDQQRQAVTLYVGLCCAHGELPAACDFFAVRSHDVTTGGISYFCSEPPEHVDLVICLGTDEQLTSVLSKVESHRAAVVHGEAGYIVVCRFVRRLDGPGIPWDEVLAVASER